MWGLSETDGSSTTHIGSLDSELSATAAAANRDRGGGGRRADSSADLQNPSVSNSCAPRQVIEPWRRLDSRVLHPEIEAVPALRAVRCTICASYHVGRRRGGGEQARGPVKQPACGPLHKSPESRPPLLPLERAFSTSGAAAETLLPE